MRLLAGMERQPVVIDHDHLAVAPDDGAEEAAKVERHDGDVLDVDILPDVRKLGPVREREDADQFTLVLAGVVEVPRFGALVLRNPGGTCRRCRGRKKNALLGARDFSSSRRAPPKSRIKAVFVEGLSSSHRSS